MKNQEPNLSGEFQRLYCDAAVFEGFSAWHPISFTRVLPFQAQDSVVDDARLLAAEAALLAAPAAATRQAVVEALGAGGLLSAEDLANLLPVVDVFDADFFELIGDVYVTAGMHVCALRWYREYIADLEANHPGTLCQGADVYASVGYCLYSLGLYAEAVAWSKSCLGPQFIAAMVSRALIAYEAQSREGDLVAIERSGNRTRYTASADDRARAASEASPRLMEALQSFKPVQETCVDWVDARAPLPQIGPEDYPFQLERDNGPMPRHRLNLIFSLCGQADELAALGYAADAKYLLCEAKLLEPRADFIQEKLELIG